MRVSILAALAAFFILVVGCMSVSVPIVRPPIAIVPPVPPARLDAPGATLPTTLSFGVEPGRLDVGGAAMASAVRTDAGATYAFPSDFQPASPESYHVAAAQDAILGPAQRISAEYRSPDQAVAATVEVTAARSTSALLYQVRLASSEPLVRFSLLDEAQSRLDLPGPVEYLTILSPGHLLGTLEPGDATVAVPLPPGAPLFLWSEEAQRGYVLGLLDETSGRRRVSLSPDGKGGLRIGIETGPSAAAPTISPRLYVERVTTRDLTQALAGYRAALDVVAPVPPIPDGFRQQWGSWYVYGGSITEERVREQIDAIAANYADLGPWQVVIDAGWYRAGSDPDGEIGLVDLDKFPSGMRALVDYAHERGVGVVLYGSAPWVDSHPGIDSWWVVQLGFVRDHQDWLTLIEGDDEGATYVYDLSNPALRAYLGGLIRRYLVEFDADGILLDMVGVIGPTGGPFRGEPPTSAVPGSQIGLAETMDIYRALWQTAHRLKPNVWIESGYAAPPLARSYANTWRLADDYPAFSHPYPFAGLLEQITFAILQEQLLGRLHHLGFIYGGEETLPVQRQWLGAAVALQSQTILSTDLTSVSTETARMYREYLTALRPFAGTTIFGPGIPPEVFSTTVDGTTYLGLLNADAEPRTTAVDLAAHGLTGQALIYDPESGQVFTSDRYLSAMVPAQHFTLLVARSTPGVLWADRSWSAELDGDTLIVHVQPSPFGGGRLRIHAPGVREVSGGGYWTLDPRAGLLTVDLPDGGVYELRIAF